MRATLGGQPVESVVAARNSLAALGRTPSSEFARAILPMVTGAGLPGSRVIVWVGRRFYTFDPKDVPQLSFAPFVVGGAWLADGGHPMAGVAAVGLVGPTGRAGAPWFPAGRIAKPVRL